MRKTVVIITCVALVVLGVLTYTSFRKHSPRVDESVVKNVASVPIAPSAKSVPFPDSPGLIKSRSAPEHIPSVKREEPKGRAEHAEDNRSSPCVSNQSSSIDLELSFEELMGQARAHISRRSYDKATPLLEAALAKSRTAEERVQILSLLADSYGRTQRFEAAERCLQELTGFATSDNERVSASIRLANLHALQGEYGSAERVLEKVTLVGSNDSVRGRIEAAEMHIWQLQPGRLNQVASNLQSRVDSNSADQVEIQQLGTIYLKYEKDYQKAKPIYEMILAQNPTNSSLQNTMINIYQKTHDFQKAKAVYQSYLKGNPDEADGIHYQIASLDLKAGRGDNAVEYAKKNLAGEDATTGQLKLVARICEQSGRIEDAMHLLARAADKADSDDVRVDIAFQQVDILILQKQYDQAEASLREIINQHGDSANIKSQANKELIRIYQLQGRLGELQL